MTVLAFDFLHDDPPTVKMYSSKREAQGWRNDWFIPADAEALANQNILAPTSRIIELYNSLAEEPVTRFQDRLVAAKRLFEICNLKLNPEKDINEMATASTAKKPSTKALATADKAKKATAKKATAAKAAKKAPKTDGNGRGRAPALAGHKLVHAIAPDADKTIVNPRRKDSNGFKSLQLIIDAGKTGITTEDYLKAGGRINDLNWDVEHGNVTATPTK